MLTSHVIFGALLGGKLLRTESGETTEGVINTMNSKPKIHNSRRRRCRSCCVAGASGEFAERTGGDVDINDRGGSLVEDTSCGDSGFVAA